ncbi:MAG: hypothetical protein IJS27_01340 [Ruminococcus sp.]|nr:hypothetical protein [Ruminococcus sp.]
MKNGMVIKNMSAPDITDEMALVNTYSRRELSPEEVYLFTVALCDNDIDRDNERFTVESLFALEKLFVGKTGIIDHDPTAKNQKARIISCKVESVEGRKTALGDDLFRLTARAYIRRTEANAELIDQIEAGIVKEVSVGCSVEKTVCSVCRNDMRSPACTHIKGRVYSGERCFGELCEPTDAYEFSFVAVPAQRAAGVIKSTVKENHMENIKSVLECEKDILLAKSDLDSLREYIAQLEKQAQFADAYKVQLREQLKKCLQSRQIELEYAAEKSIIEKLDVDELLALIKAMDKQSSAPRMPQLMRTADGNTVGNTEFRI